MTPFELVKGSDAIYGCHIDGVCGTDLQDFAAELKLLLLKYGITNIRTSISTNAQISIIEGKLLILDTVIKGSGEITNPKPDPVLAKGDGITDDTFSLQNGGTIKATKGYELDA